MSRKNISVGYTARKEIVKSISKKRISPKGQPRSKRLSANF